VLADGGDGDDGGRSGGRCGFGHDLMSLLVPRLEGDFVGPRCDLRVERGIKQNCMR
jgi:hypothetical protein